MNQVIDFSTLTWVRNELHDTLKEARQALEAHLERPQDEAQLGFLAAHLHQVYGTLQMVELYGAALLAEEMEQVAKAIAGQIVTQHDDACEVLMRAMLQLPDYLDRLNSGFRDIPIVLLPLLNDLRAVRGENLLSENSMFTPDLGAALPESLLNTHTDGDIRQMTRDLRHRFQLGLLGWFREKDTEMSLSALLQALDGLQQLGGHARVVRLWWVAAGLVESLMAGVLVNGVAMKRVLGQVDREIKRMIDRGEDALIHDTRDDLFKNLLFYCAQSPATTSVRVAQIQETYRLKELLPDEAELAAARESLSGRNLELFQTVAVAVKEELALLKDSLDIFLRHGCRDSKELGPLIAALRSLADTLAMLSLGAARKAVVAKAVDLQSYVDSGGAPADTSLMDVASTLLFVESSVDTMGCGRAAASDETQVEDQLAANEYQHVMEVVVQEAIADLIRAKEAIVSYIASDHDTAQLNDVPQWFNQVKGGLLLLGEARPAALVDSIARYIDKDLIQGRRQAGQPELDALADAVCGLEYYLESRKEHRMYGGSAIAVAERGVDRLGYPTQQNKPANATDTETGTQETAAEPAEYAAFEASSREPAPMSDGRPAAENLPAGQGFEFDFSLLEEPLVAESDDPAAAAPQEHGDPLEEAASEPASNRVHVKPVEPFESQVLPADLVKASTAPIQPDELPEIEEAAPVSAVTGVEEDDDALAVIGADVDDEILEIFIEEAEEELASITEQLPVWLANTDDADSLGSIRRSYHTLKGSGRLVGAMRVGEFAWAFENMLNCLIDGTLSVSPELTGLLRSALEALPELIQQIRDGVPTRQPVAHLMRSAEALSRGDALPELATAPVRCEPAEAESTPEAQTEMSNEDSVVAERFVEPVLNLESTTLPIDQLEEPQPVAAALSEPSEPEPLSDDTSGEEPDGEESVLYADSVMDPLLYDIFNTESQSHLDVVREFLAQAVVGESRVDETLARALHTMHGSAHMAEAHVIAELAGELERLLKLLLGAGLPVEKEVCEALEASVVIIEAMLSSLPERTTEPQDYTATLQHVKDLSAAIPPADYHEASLESQEDEETLLNAPETHERTASTPEEQMGDDQVASSSIDEYAQHDAELLEIFLEEGGENLETCDAALQRWRESAGDSSVWEELQRALHTLKGGARMADLGTIGDVAHAAESLIVSISEGRADHGEAAMGGVQHAHDCLTEMLNRVRSRQPVEAADQVVAELKALRAQTPSVTSDRATEGQQAAPEAEVEAAGDVPDTLSVDPYAETDPEILQVFLEEANDIMEHCEQTLQGWKHKPGDQSLMAELQRELHTLKGGARMADITEIGDLAHAVESLMVKVNEGEVTCGETTFRVLEQAQDTLAGMLEQVRNRRPLKPHVGIIADLEKLRDGLEGVVAAPGECTDSTTRGTMEGSTEFKERRAKSRSSQELVRVKTDLLDNMVNFAGEVSIYRSRLEQQVGAYSFNLVEMEQTVARVREQLRKLEIETEAQVLYRYEREGELLDGAANSEDFDPLEMDRYSHMQQLSRSLMESVSDLSSIQNLLENITRESETLLLQQARVNTELQEGLMRTRMVPFLGLAARMRRIVRQTAQEVGKKAELELSGAEGEMDRTVVDRIVAPIEHMLRNAISHGIEAPQKRLQKGKPETGTIRITLERESSDVVLRIADDGAGINLSAIRKKAIERGLMPADSELTDNEVLQFILETGFSTAEKVTQVAGRGVGMDVVNSEVKQLGGSLHIDSEYNRGTTFTIRLPFTLALNQALLIEVGEDTYAIPLSSIEGIVLMRREDLKAYYDDPNTRFEYGGYAYEVRHLGTALGTSTPRLDSGPKRLPVLLAGVGEHCVAFQVENLLGSREIVVKSVGPQISTVRGLSGATILGDGRVVMILDIAALLRTGSTGLDQINNIISQPTRTGRLTVMVVDDSITVRKVTTRVLERNDMNVIAAKDGVDAVSKLQENIPDIMLLDIEMPRMDGFELATHVRNEPRLRDIPIIMITSRTGDKHRQRAMQIGVNRYLGKPFQESELLENIQALLEETTTDG